MSVVLTTIRYLQAEGFPAEKILELVAQLEETTAHASEQSAFRVDSADKRRTWDRERKAAQRAAEREAKLSGGQSGGNPPDVTGKVDTKEDTLSPSKAESKSNSPRKRTVRTPFPDNFEPTEADMACAREVGLKTMRELRQAIVHCRDHHNGKGNTVGDPHATLRTWLRSPYRRQPPANGAVNGKAQSPQEFARTLAERFQAPEPERRAEFTVIRGGADEDTTRLLPQGGSG
jgi:DNA-binding transcriptional MerR regulator